MMKLKSVFKPALGLLFVFGCLLALTPSAVLAEGAAAAEAPEKCPRKVKVLVDVVTTSTFNEYKMLEKRALPAMDTEVSCQTAGNVKTVEKAVGNAVKAGDVLLTLDTEKFQAELDAAKGEAARWKRILRRRQNWKVRSPRAEKQAGRKIKAFEDTAKQLEEKLAICTVTAPVDGVLHSISVNAGDAVTAGAVIGHVVDISTVKLAMTKFAGKVNDGDKVKVKIKKLKKVVKGVVKKSSPDAAEIIIKNPAGKILIGMTAKFAILFKVHTDAVVLKKSRLIKEDGGIYAFITDEKGKRAIKKSLETGPVTKNKVLIKSGLAAGDNLIVAEVLSAKEMTLREGFPCLEPNKKIKVLEKGEGDTFTTKKIKKPAPVAPPPPAPKVEEKVKKDEPAERKPEPKAEPKKEVKPEEPEIAPVDKFVDFLKKNKYNLYYKNFKTLALDDAFQVRIECDSDAKSNIVRALDQFEVRQYAVEIIAKGEYFLDVFFPREGKTRLKPKRITRAGRVFEPREPQTFLERLRVGLNLSYFRMFDTNFEDVYGRMIGFGGDIAFAVNRKIDIWASFGFSSKTTSVDWAPEELKFKFIPFSLDARYFFTKGRKFDIFGGAGINVYSITETLPESSPLEDISETAIGFNLLGGTYYHLTDKLSLQMILRFNLVSKSLENTDNDLKMNSAELLFGLNYNF